jgi:hypothetical protein
MTYVKSHRGAADEADIWRETELAPTLNSMDLRYPSNPPLLIASPVEPGTTRSNPERSTSSAGGSPVNHSASPANAAAKETNASSGPSFFASSPSFGLGGSSSKTCRDSRPTSPTMSRTTDVYAAGLIDGEGCLYIDRTLTPMLDVGMAESAMPLLAKLKTTYGGTLKKFRPATEEWQAGWTWRLSGKPCVETLTLLLPHLRLKAPQARLILTLQALKDSTMLPGGSRARFTPETRERAEQIRAEVKALNRRGPDAEWEWPDGADAVLVGDTWLSPQRDLLSETGYGEFSGTFPTSGLAWGTGSLTAFSTAVSSECRSVDGACSSSEPSLTEILEPPQNVPDRYSLSGRAARAILRRAEKRGRTLPGHLQAALEAVAGAATTELGRETPSSPVSADSGTVARTTTTDRLAG